MTLTIEFDLDSIKLNQLVKYLGQTSFRYKVRIVQKSDRQADTFDRLQYLKLNNKVLGSDAYYWSQCRRTRLVTVAGVWRRLSSSVTLAYTT